MLGHGSMVNHELKEKGSVLPLNTELRKKYDYDVNTHALES